MRRKLCNNKEKTNISLSQGFNLRVDSSGDVLLRSPCTVWISRGMKSEMVERGREIRV